MRRVLVGLVPVLLLMGLAAGPEPQALACWLDALGPLGPLGMLGMLGAFAVGSLLAFPGLLLVAMAMVGFETAGPVLVLVGSVLYVVTPFLVMRGLGRGVPAEPAEPKRWTRAALVHVDRHPVLTVAVLRLVGHLSAPVSVALSLTDIRFRDYVVGSAIGLVLPLSAVVFGLSHTAVDFVVTAPPADGVCVEEPLERAVQSALPGQ